MHHAPELELPVSKDRYREVDMVGRTPAMAKFARRNTKGVLLRENLFKALGNVRSSPILWIQSPAGAGKTTLISSYLESQGIPCLWYQVDESDGDLASFFYYMRQAVLSVQPENKEKSQLSLLTPEYTTSMPLFMRRFFEQLFQEINQERIVVFDNYQAVSDKPLFHKTMVKGLTAIPPGRQVIIVSREAPPSVFARLKANGNMVVLSWEQLRLSLNESKQIAELRGYRLSEAQMARVYESCEGWAAGLVLFLKVEEACG
ncbi:MAG: hypothetical protein EHM38_08300, partial [Geobacteraceae bacterium]